jgi:hypothetical protein
MAEKLWKREELEALFKSKNWDQLYQIRDQYSIPDDYNKEKFIEVVLIEQVKAAEVPDWLIDDPFTGPQWLEETDDEDVIPPLSSYAVLDEEKPAEPFEVDIVSEEAVDEVVDTPWPDFIDKLVSDLPPTIRGNVQDFLLTISPVELIQTALMAYLFNRFVLDQDDPEAWPIYVRKWVSKLPQKARKPAEEFLGTINPRELFITAVGSYLYQRFVLDKEVSQTEAPVVKPTEWVKVSLPENAKPGDPIVLKKLGTEFKVPGWWKPGEIVQVEVSTGLVKPLEELSSTGTRSYLDKPVSEVARDALNWIRSKNK